MQELLREVLGESLGEDDDAESLALPLAGTHDPDDVLDDQGGIADGSRKFLQGWMDAYLDWVRRHA